LLDSAENARLTDVASVVALARAHAGHRGAGRLLAALDTHTPGTTLTKSELEERFLALCRANGLPAPLVNESVNGFEVDFAFPGARLIVETDGWSWHRTRHAFERDATGTRFTRAPATAPSALPTRSSATSRMRSSRP